MYRCYEMSQNGRTTMLGTVKWFAKIWERMLRRVLDALLPEPLERVRVREERQRAKVRAAPFHCA